MKIYPLIGTNGEQVGKSIDLKNAVLFVKTWTSGVKHSSVPCDVWTILKFGEGNFNYRIAEEITYEQDRKKLDDVSAGAEQALQVNFEGKATFMGSRTGEPYTIGEIIKGRNFTDGTMQFAGTGEEWLTRFGCPPYACELELHTIPQLECPNLQAYGEAHLFRYFRSPDVGWDISAKRVSVQGACHVLAPLILRPNFYDLYAALEGREAGATLLARDCLPLQELGQGWALDPRESAFSGSLGHTGTPVEYTPIT